MKGLSYIIRKKNFGLAKNIVSGINYVFKENDKAIILEDDIIVSPFFLNYMNKNLNIYKNDKKASFFGFSR